MPCPVMWTFINITMADADHKQKEVGPAVAKLIYKITTPYFAKKGSNNH